MSQGRGSPPAPIARAPEAPGRAGRTTGRAKSVGTAEVSAGYGRVTGRSSVGRKDDDGLERAGQTELLLASKRRSGSDSAKAVGVAREVETIEIERAGLAAGAEVVDLEVVDHARAGQAVVFVQ